jgi:hypothetical protein
MGGAGLMSDSPGAISPESLPRPGEIALLTAVNVALDVPADQLPSRVALVRHYIDAALAAVPGSRRATLLVTAQMLARDLSQDPAADGDGHRSQ